ncbi:MAG: hypothetical protein RHS_3665 [Robinsoniella sp. RHS]|nr:MAG: hypothetical protein RHS_3665 [Robinsoniella sp. RHS]
MNPSNLIEKIKNHENIKKLNLFMSICKVNVNIYIKFISFTERNNGCMM